MALNWPFKISKCYNSIQMITIQNLAQTYSGRVVTRKACREIVSLIALDESAIDGAVEIVFDLCLEYLDANTSQYRKNEVAERLSNLLAPYSLGANSELK